MIHCLVKSATVIKICMLQVVWETKIFLFWDSIYATDMEGLHLWSSSSIFHLFSATSKRKTRKRKLVRTYLIDSKRHQVSSQQASCHQTCLQINSYLVSLKIEQFKNVKFNFLKAQIYANSQVLVVINNPKALLYI